MKLSTDISGAGAERPLYDDAFQEGGHRSNKLSRNKGYCNGEHRAVFNEKKKKKKEKEHIRTRDAGIYNNIQSFTSAALVQN